MEYYSSTAFNHYRKIDDLKRVSNLVSELDANLPIIPIEIPRTDKDIENALFNFFDTIDE